MKLLIPLALCSPFLSACAATDRFTDPQDVMGSDWRVTRLEANEVPADAGLTLRIEDALMTGHTGVNRFNGPVLIEPDGLFRAGPFAMTRMAGPPAAMDLESLLLVSLERADSWQFDHGELRLMSGIGDVLVAERVD